MASRYGWTAATLRQVPYRHWRLMRSKMQTAKQHEALVPFQAAVLCAFLQGAFKKGTKFQDALKQTGLAPDAKGKPQKPRKEVTAQEAIARAREIAAMDKRSRASA